MNAMFNVSAIKGSIECYTTVECSWQRTKVGHPYRVQQRSWAVHRPRRQRSRVLEIIAAHNRVSSIFWLMLVKQSSTPIGWSCYYRFTDASSVTVIAYLGNRGGSGETRSLQFSLETEIGVFDRGMVSHSIVYLDAFNPFFNFQSGLYTEYYIELEFKPRKSSCAEVSRLIKFKTVVVQL